MSRLLNAVFQNDLAKITTLLDRDPRSAREIEALCQGIGWGRKEAVMLLVQRGADLNAKDRNKNHPLNMACHSSALDLFEELVRHGSDPAHADGLAVDAAWGGRTDVLRYLHESGFNLNQPNARGIRPIEAAIGMGNLGAVEYLLSVDVDIGPIDVSKPLEPWKGALPEPQAMDEIRRRIVAHKTEPGGPANAAPPHR
jgi:ankyrin repeat protein